MSASMTVHFATRWSDEPDRLSSSPILSMADAVSPAIPAFALSVPSWPATNSRLPTRTTEENGLVRLFGITNSGSVDCFADGAVVGFADEQAAQSTTSAARLQKRLNDVMALMG